MRVDWPGVTLRVAARLVPGSLRADWLAEWEAELWYVRRAGGPVASFCSGAVWDAFLLSRLTRHRAPRLESPVQCLLVLAILAAASLLLAVWWPIPREEIVGSSEADSRLVEIAPHHQRWKVTPAISAEQYQAWSRHLPAQLTAVAFSARLPELPGAKVLIDRSPAPPLPAMRMGFVVARLRARPASFGHISLPVAEGGSVEFDYRALAPGPRDAWGALLLTSLAAWLVLRSTDCRWPGKRRPLPWVFLAAKFLLVLPLVVFGSLDLGYLAGVRIEGLLMLTGWVAAMRWVLEDQRRRCPVCLRLLINPVGIGQASQTFLGWYGTELMCSRGHGMLHLPELPGSSSSISRWVQFDPSWTGLF